MTTRRELYNKLGLRNPIADSVLNAAYGIEEQYAWENNVGSSPHGEPWHTSFHASSFPGDDEKACGRKAIYTLMDIPSEEPFSRAGRAVMEAGKSIEEHLVWRFYNSGVLLTDSPGAKVQTGFTDEEHWLTGSPDAVIKTPSTTPRPLPVEIKTKDGEIVIQMREKKKSYDEAHRRQALTYIGLAVENQEFLWPDLAPIKDGELLYVSRNRPDQTHTYRFDYDPEFMQQGRERLSEWKNSYLDELLPERPKSWRWTEPPCKWCPLKRRCKADYKEGITKLADSNAIISAKEIRPDYDYEQTRKAVLDRWNPQGVINLPEQGNLYEASIALFFPAFDRNEADAKLEEALDILFDEGFEVDEESVVLEESVTLDE